MRRTGPSRDPVPIAQSAGAYLGDRYGDYFGAARDPQDPGLVWVAGEAGTAVVGERGWATVVASVSITAAGAPPPPVLGASPTGVRAVHVVARGGHVGKARLPSARRRQRRAHGRRRAVAEPRRVHDDHAAKATLQADQLYVVLVASPEEAARHFSYCAHSISSSGAPSLAELLDRHAALSSSSSRAAYAGAVGASSWRK